MATPLASRNRLGYVPPTRREYAAPAPSIAADMYGLLHTSYLLFILAFFKSIIDKLALSRRASRAPSQTNLAAETAREPEAVNEPESAGERETVKHQSDESVMSVPLVESTEIEGFNPPAVSSPKRFSPVLPQSLTAPPYSKHLYDSLFELDSSDDDIDVSQYGTSLAFSKGSTYKPTKRTRGAYADYTIDLTKTDTNTDLDVFADDYDKAVSRFYTPFRSVPRPALTLTDAILSAIPSTGLLNFLKKERLAIQELILKERKQSQAAVAPLSRDQLDVVDLYWRSRLGTAPVVSAYSIDISVRDLYTLADGHWLNDNIIDFYLNLVSEKSDNVYCWTTHFFSTLKSKGYAGVARWAKRRKVNVTEKKLVVVPINIMSTHWAVAVVDNLAKTIKYHDSLSSNGNQSAVRLLQQYMAKECERLQVPPIEYELLPNMKTPQQQNGYDCGVFTCTVSKHIAQGLPLSFSQNDMKTIRRRMAYEIIQKSLLDDKNGPHL